ncbi:MAG: hypothetical protein AB7S78_13585 [Candidatus Omnitrophota bacterium]
MSYYQNLEKIEFLIQQYNDTNAASLKLLVRADKDLEREFLNKLSSLDWFEWMQDNNYFKPETIAFDVKGNALFWGVLDYLEKVSGHASQQPKYGKDLIKIIDDVIQFTIHRKPINNPHFWWYFVKILKNLPSSVIKDNLKIDKFNTWISVWVNYSSKNDMGISDIGEKLLPKFLSDDFAPDYPFAETIIEVITAIKAGGKSYSFTRRDDAVLAWDSYWIQDAFKKYGELIGKKCSIKVVLGLAERLRRALEYKQKNHYSDFDVDNNVYRITVERVSIDGLQPGQIGFQEGQYQCVVKQFSDEQLRNIDRGQDFWALHKADPETDINQYFFSALTKDVFLTELKSKLPKDINWQSTDNFENKLSSIYTGLFSDYSHVWCRSLKSGPENGDGAEEILTNILRDVLLVKCEINRAGGREILNTFLTDKFQFPIFRRFVLICADRYWADYSELLEKLLEVVPTILGESDLEVETQDVFQHHNISFTPKIKTKIKELINQVPEYYLKKGDEKLIAYWKYKWLSPLRENADFSVLYEQAKQKVEPKDGKPYEPERSSFKGGFITHKSPVTKEEILQKPIGELVKYLADFKGADFWHGVFEGEPDKEGLADTLQAAVKEEPKKFTDGLEALVGLDYFYLHRILRGLKDAGASGKELDWNKIFDFYLEYLKRGKDNITKEALEAQGEDSGKGRYLWIIDAIVNLIEDGSKDDNKAFLPEYFDKVEQIFDLIIPLLKGEKHPDTQRDALTYALNTTLGRSVMTYVSFSLRVARATQKKQKNWGSDKFERFLSIGIDGYIWFGCYLPQMRYLDNEYVDEKIKFFAQKTSDDFEWQMFMEGYLTGSRVYRDLYGLMRLNYLKAIENKIFEGRTEERLVEHICIGYLQMDEALAENNKDGTHSLFWKMLNDAADDKRGRWEDVASFFWSISPRTLRKEDKESQDEPSEDIKKRIVAFWAWTYKEQAQVKEKLGDAYSSFLSRMAELTIWLDRIDESAEKWIILSAPYIEIQHRSGFLIEYMTKFTDEESVRRISNIFLKILEYATPMFREQEIKIIIERLYNVGEKDKSIKTNADMICNAYGRRGIHFLKELWAKNQNL